ncbi:Protein of unknown function [Desulfomicrobium norvegicum]|uniref:DUF2845 domain-containing protein n=1 Tax=Desulfomicrobium norvegicum (strain DSM 1741 / NCIMB 8310) TaxID=52561 RepID=A0A8G2C4C1_DESNO|nr:DUF2845 domain-containing protein [Desulfomicrobium norvegicum]SFL95617.1 Protein of unknown function [Desulfomicrobium norvegicum]
MRKHFFLLTLLLFLTTPAQAADLRCQGDLMTPGTIITKVRQKCGDPRWEDRIGEVTRTNRGGERLLYITQLTYEASGGYYVLTFEGGELKQTEFFQK